MAEEQQLLLLGQQGEGGSGSSTNQKEDRGDVERMGGGGGDASKNTSRIRPLLLQRSVSTEHAPGNPNTLSIRKHHYHEEEIAIHANVQVLPQPQQYQQQGHVDQVVQGQVQQAVHAPVTSSSPSPNESALLALTALSLVVSFVAMSLNISPLVAMMLVAGISIVLFVYLKL